MDDEEPEHGGLGLALYAAVMAHLRHFPPKKGPVVLAKLGVEGQWPAAKRGFDALLMAESDEGEDRWLKRFGEAYSPVKERLAAERPALDTLGPLVAPPMAVAPPPATLPAPEAPPPAAPPPTAPEAPSAPTFAPLPLFVAPSRPKGPSREDGTPLPVQPAMVRGPRVGETADISSVLGSLRGAMPFAAERSRVTPTPAAAPAPKSSVPTGTADLGSVLPRAAVPFPAASAPREAAPASRVSVETVQGYSVLAAELSVHWAHASAVLARHGLHSAEQKAALDQRWNERFQREPGLRSEWQGLVERYVAWFRAGGRRGP
jgi:hypothetical protein